MIIIIIVSIKLWLLHERLPTSENGRGGGGEEVSHYDVRIHNTFLIILREITVALNHTH